jgi:hypothetical protein
MDAGCLQADWHLPWVHAFPDCSHGNYLLAMQLRIWAATVPWNLSMLATKKKAQGLALRCLMHLRAESRHPRLSENLRLVFVLVKWEFQVQVRPRDVL